MIKGRQVLSQELDLESNALRSQLLWGRKDQIRKSSLDLGSRGNGR